MSDDAEPRRAGIGLFLAGIAMGVVAAMCGIGGGLFAVPLLHFGFHVPLRRAVATSLLLVLATALSATGTELARDDSALRLTTVLPLAGGALVGAQLGYLVSRRLDPRVLRAVFVVVLTLAGTRILLSSSGGPEPSELVAPPWSDAALIALMGVAGGIVAPVVGIGGGLVFVPALYLGFPGLGFAGARATSLAAAVVTASRSTWLYAREGAILRRHGLLLASGAMLGAIAGVTLVHRPEWIGVARRALGGVLWFTAIRFALDVWRSRGASREDSSGDSAEATQA